MTFEQASARGLVFRREDDTQLTFLDGIHNHFRAALATVETAARGREKLLRDFLEFRRSAIAEGEAGAVQQYVLVAGADRARLDRLAALLAGQGIDLRAAAGELRAGTRSFPAGSIVVPLAQPAGRLVRNLLDPRVSMDEAFVKEQDRRRKKRLPDEIYDVTAWSLPLVFDVDCVGVAALSGEMRPFAPDAAAGEPALAAAKVAWLLPWGSGTAAAVTEAVQAGLKVRVAEAGLQLGGRAFPAGTAIVRVAENPDGARETLGRIVRRHHAEAVAEDSGYVADGVSLGSERVHLVKKSRVLLAWDRPTSGLSAGWARWVLERRYGQPVTAVRVSSLGHVDLARYDVLVLPSGDYDGTIRTALVKRIRDWVSAGGTLVALGEASRWLTRERVGLLDTKTELRDGRPEPEPSVDEKKEEKDPEHWLAAGTDGEIHAIVESRRVFTPLKLDKGTNVGVYAKKDQVVGSGLVWDDVRDLLAQKAFLMHQPTGEGHIIAFAEDPNHRGYAEATELLFMNAVLLGPAY
jgi:hypothetical protein